MGPTASASGTSDGLVSTTHAALRLGCSSRRVRAMIDEGRLRAERVGRAWLVDSATIDAVLRLRSTDRRPWG